MESPKPVYRPLNHSSFTETTSAVSTSTPKRSSLSLSRTPSPSTRSIGGAPSRLASCLASLEECDLTVFQDAPESLLLARRLEQDVKSRGYSVERVMRLFPELKRDYEKFIGPVKGVADVVVVVGKERM